MIQDVLIASFGPLAKQVKTTTVLGGNTVAHVLFRGTARFLLNFVPARHQPCYIYYVRALI
jgi:hypothetical protein